MIITDNTIILNKEEIESSKYYNYQSKYITCKRECSLQNYIKQYLM